jgi:hypothetical protein
MFNRRKIDLLSFLMRDTSIASRKGPSLLGRHNIEKVGLKPEMSPPVGTLGLPSTFPFF